MQLLFATSLAAFAVGALTSSIETPVSDAPAIADELNDINTREAEADALHAWEKAHGGQPIEYESDLGTLPEIHGHYFEERAVPDSEASEVDASLGGYGLPLVTRDVSDPHGEQDAVAEEDQDAHLLARGIPDFGDKEVDISLEGYDHKVMARSVSGHGEPDFGGAEVDVSLSGYDHVVLARSLPESDDEANLAAPLEGYDGPLLVKPLPDFGDLEVDTSLEGYDHEVLARAVVDLGYAHGEELVARSLPQTDEEGADEHAANRYSPDRPWTGVLPTTELHIPPSATGRPNKESVFGGQHTAREVLGKWWKDLKHGNRGALHGFRVSEEDLDDRQRSQRRSVTH
ncbi:hypothetical protein LTR53_007131 [Teratosphaeriaceae sp. CCFEE 6253]|nr:hypothetical protein LTR53_007131 [Teratosphaeriaceae sp. CCFEE 6253]